MVKKNIGGHMLAALFGSATVAYVVTVFFIAPFVGLTNYAFNLLTVLGGILSFQTSSVIFLAIWILVYLGYIGVAFRGSRR